MNAQTVSDAGLWWMTVQLVALLALPLSWLLFRSMPAAGYALHKAFGLAVVTLLARILMAAGLLPNTRGALEVVLMLLGAASLLALKLKEPTGELWSRLRVQVIVG